MDPAPDIAAATDAALRGAYERLQSQREMHIRPDDRAADAEAAAQRIADAVPRMRELRAELLRRGYRCDPPRTVVVHVSAPVRFT